MEKQNDLFVGIKNYIVRSDRVQLIRYNQTDEEIEIQTNGLIFKVSATEGEYKYLVEEMAAIFI